MIVAVLIGGQLLIGPPGAAVLAEGGTEPVEVLIQDSGGTLQILPNPAKVNVGDTVTVDVYLAGAENIWSIDLRFTFDREKVSVVPYSEWEAARPRWEVFDPNPLRHIVLGNGVSPVDGTSFDEFVYIVTNLNPAVPFTGSGAICSITFSGLSAGTHPLHFTYVKGVNLVGTNLGTAYVDGSITVGDPTAVAISRFVARPMGRSVRVLWSTEQETSILGFNLYRSEDLAGEPLRLNDAIIPGKAMGSPAGAQYQFADRSVEPGVLYHYWLESVGLDGAATRLGPESAAAAQFLLDPPVQ
jgi:hypothetical protein